MKSIIKLSCAVLFIGFLAWGCGNSGGAEDKNADQTEVHHGEGPEYNSAYVCPMHCEGSGSDKAGTCPVCGMDYVAQSDHAADGHDHGNHDGHNH